MTQISLPRRATIHDVAKAAGVSAATVSNALSRRRPVDPVTQARVHAIAHQLSYVPDPAAQRLRTGRPAAIALLSTMPAAVAAGQSRLGFMMEIAAAAAEVAMEAGLAMVLVPPAETGPPRLDHLDVAGAIVIEPLVDDPCIAHLLGRGVAVVAIGHADAPVAFVDLRTEVIAELMLDHLRDRGCCRVALLLGQQARPSYAEMLGVYTRRVTDPIVVRADEQGGEAAGRMACLHLLEAYPDIDAICAPVDAFAAGAVLGLHDAGRSIPADVQVITRYDGLRARLCVPPLTAVDLDLDAVARRAVAVLMRELHGETGVALPVVAMPELVIRGSTQALQASPRMV